MSHECIQLKAKHGKQHLLQQIMFTIYKDTLNTLNVALKIQQCTPGMKEKFDFENTYY